jgi:hypothetical protein
MCIVKKHILHCVLVELICLVLEHKITKLFIFPT